MAHCDDADANDASSLPVECHRNLFNDLRSLSLFFLLPILCGLGERTFVFVVGDHPFNPHLGVIVWLDGMGFDQSRTIQHRQREHYHDVHDQANRLDWKFAFLLLLRVQQYQPATSHRAGLRGQCRWHSAPCSTFTDGPGRWRCPLQGRKRNLVPIDPTGSLLDTGRWCYRVHRDHRQRYRRLHVQIMG